MFFYEDYNFKKSSNRSTTLLGASSTAKKERTEQCDGFTNEILPMKKLKKFVVQSTSLLTREEMALIQGGANLYLLDNCGANDRDKSCVYGLYDTPYGQTIVPGVCQVKYEAYHGYIIPVGFCAKP